jgi:hypothetical protein
MQRASLHVGVRGQVGGDLRLGRIQKVELQRGVCVDASNEQVHCAPE